ncbi:purine-nucleoside phosphorylase [Flavisolibacter ginsenosidimutans]|uniref:Purine nucleoside phosphorylase n=2 Tax=Flavisolibacter ginsenosidimutans TaxID=661481 RepID=A0A5B8UPH6_9BACT|nr:purine-nucleoside phosphorylase [Flavisolibacter ginsenosidimutans]
MSTMEKLKEAANFLQQYNTSGAKTGVVLGSGLGDFVKEIQVKNEIPYEDIPHFPVSTVEGHHGKLIFGTIGGKPLVAMAGRFHFYEGYSPEDVVFPIRVMKFLGIETLLISNAAGGVGEGFKVGDLMIINDHISFAIQNPLLGANDNNLGPRFTDMSEPYKKDLIAKAKTIAQRLSIDLKEGVYFGVTGPTFETRAEYKLIHLLGAHAVGMSTVQEVIAAVHAGMKVFAISVITDIGIREEENTITHQEVLQAAAEAAPKLSAIFRELIVSL